MKGWNVTANGLLALIGLLSWGLAILSYWRYGFSSWLWINLLGGCAALCVAGMQASRASQTSVAAAVGRLGRRDWLLVLIILAICAPLYLVNVHNFPRQVNTDEVAIMNAERILSSRPSVDIYGPSFYSDLPVFIFWFLGKIGVMLGGVGLAHARMAHAASGVVIIVLVFLLCRLLGMPRPGALAAAFVVALNHSFYIFARSAMRDNTSVLFELLALICLYIGWQRRHYGWIILGGFFGGLTFYTYYASRMTLVVWLVFVGVSLLARRFRGLWIATKLTAVALLGALMIAAPLFIADARHTPTDQYPTHQFLWQREGREQEWRYRGTATMAAALKINVIHGLLVFNKPYADQAILYTNPGYGFVDIVTGALLWLGVAAIIAQSIRRRHMSAADRFAFTGFLVIWLSLALLITRAPDYTRLFIVLPFVGYIIGRLVMIAAALLTRLVRRPRLMRPAQLMRFARLARRAPLAWLTRGNGTRLLSWTVALATIATIAVMNILPVRAYYRAGAQDGDGVGDTMRFEEQHNTENAAWLFAPGITTQYFSWGIPEYWAGWINFAKGDNQPLQMATVDDILSNQINSLPPGAHGYFLTTSETWATVQTTFENHWRVLNVHYLDPSNNRVIVEYVPQ